LDNLNSVIEGNGPVFNKQLAKGKAALKEINSPVLHHSDSEAFSEEEEK
jgi:hypothetical protein